MQIPSKTNNLKGGVQKLYFFPNDFGASVIRHRFSYGFNEGKWELAVLKGTPEAYSLCYSTPITDGVIGHLSEEEVENILSQIEILPSTN